MAKMHSRARGKSGSKRPYDSNTKSWVKYSPEEVEQLVVKLGKAGKSTAQVGLELRDSYGIPSVYSITKKRVQKILNNAGVKSQLPEDLMALIRKENSLSKHLNKNKQDKTVIRGLLLTNSKIRRLSDYYKRKGILPEKWFYNKKDVTLFS